MLLHFSKRRCLLIQSGFMWIKFHLLPLILVVSSVEVSPATVSSDTIDSSSSASVSSSSGIFFISFPWSILIFIEQNYIICIICFLLFVMLIYSFWSSWFHFYLLFNSVFLVSSISWIVTTFFCLCWTSNCMVLIGHFNLPNAFKYQQQKLFCT